MNIINNLPEDIQLIILNYYIKKYTFECSDCCNFSANKILYSKC